MWKVGLAFGYAVGSGRAGPMGHLSGRGYCSYGNYSQGVGGFVLAWVLVNTRVVSLHMPSAAPGNFTGTARHRHWFAGKPVSEIRLFQA